jgi:hypothetical protein
LSVPICYSFASKRPGVPHNKEDVETAASEVWKSFRGRFTHKPLCAFLSHGGVAPADLAHHEFDYLLRFRYQELRDVSDIVLANRSKFENILERTVTMLEYPDDEKKPRPPKDPPEPVPVDDLVLIKKDLRANRGVLLIKEHISNPRSGRATTGFESWQGLVTIARQCPALCVESIHLCCTEVFGPYDYVLEFKAETYAEARKSAGELIAKLDFMRCVANLHWFFCEPFALSD